MDLHDECVADLMMADLFGFARPYGAWITTNGDGVEMVTISRLRTGEYEVAETGVAHERVTVLDHPEEIDPVVCAWGDRILDDLDLDPPTWFAADRLRDLFVRIRSSEALRYEMAAAA